MKPTEELVHEHQVIVHILKTATAVNLLENHIAKENNVLFPMGEKLFSETDKVALEKALALVEEIETGEGGHEKYHRLAHEISDYA